MKLQLLYFDGCPSWQVADDRLAEAVKELGIRVEVERVLVSTPEEAEAWSFHGSPSVLVDGEDPFAEPGADVGLACRLYPTPAGLAGAPTVAQLVEVLAGR
ncbi:MAG: thioredoxin family protein [Actinomycetota bacterium]